MNNIKQIHNFIQEKRRFIFNKYTEYFEKTDGYCKDNEGYFDFFIKYNNGKSIYFFYDNYFKRNDNIDNDVPLLYTKEFIDINIDEFSLSKIIVENIKKDDKNNTEVLDNFLISLNKEFKLFSDINEFKQNMIERTLGQFRMDLDIKNMMQDDGKQLTEDELILHSNNYKNTEEFKKDYLNKIVFYIISKINEDYFMYYKFKNIDDFYNINMNNIFNEINNNIRKFKEILIKLFPSISNDNNIILIDSYLLNNNENNLSLEITSLGINIYSYVFGPHRLHEYIDLNIELLSDKINNDLNTSWNFNIIDENDE